MDEQQINIAVTNLNETPEILSEGDSTSLNFEVQENNSQVSTIVASDPDGDVIEFSIPQQNDYSRFVINKTSGSLSFSYPPNFEDPLDDNRDNSYQIKIRASDGKGLYAEKEVIVTVTDYSLEDSDNDGLLESEEDALGISDLNQDTDGDQLPDPWEVKHNLDPKANDSTDDPDEDILHNLAEFQNGSDPNDPDTDDDGLLDGWEINLTKTNPLKLTATTMMFSISWRITMLMACQMDGS